MRGEREKRETQESKETKREWEEEGGAREGANPISGGEMRENKQEM